MDISCEGKHAIVCGSTDGLGKACAIALANLGASITLIARHEQKLFTTLKELKKTPQQNHDFIVADFSYPNILKEKVDAYLSDGKVIHILINNSGGTPFGQPGMMTNTSEFIEAFNQHLICYHLLCQAVVPGMKKAEYGRIINITSTTAKQPEALYIISSTIRAAISNWAKTLAIELGEYGITVNNVLPGYIQTKRLEALIEMEKSTGKSETGVVQEYKNMIPLRKLGQAEDVASAVAFLASPAASYINGIDLPVDGGYLSCL